MNNWPTLKEWWQFGGALGLEIGILFLAAKLVALRLRSAPWRRALWQTAVIAMFIVVVGELNGVRGLMRPRSEPVAIVPPQRTVVVTFKDAEMPAELPLDAAGSSQPMTATQPAVVPRWQQHAAWPALVWLAGALLFASRVLLAQFIALVFRFRCRRIDDAGLNGRTERIRHTLGIRRRVALVVSKRAIAPFTFGTLRPVIVLPQRFTETFTPEQQEAALLHEMAHIAGFDSAWRGMSDLTGALLWWHPLAWLARRELAHASELAADESSLLLHDGPGRLAECLVACAKELRRPALTTWLGMDGGGFRSALGQRVTRLLELSPQARLSRPMPWFLRLIAPVVCTALLWIGMVMVMKPTAPSSDTWRTSILGNAFAAPAEKPAPMVLSEATKLEVAKLIQDGKLHYEAGGYEAARTNLQSALEIDPRNPAALYYLDLVNLQLIQTRLRERTNVTDAARQALHTKLRTLRLADWGPIDNLPLSEVIRGLNDEIMRRDTSGKGIKFFISPNAGSAGRGGAAGPALDPADLPIPAAVRASDLNGVSIRLGTKLKDLTIEEILNILMMIAETKIKYSVESFGIVISPNNEPRKSGRAGGLRLDPIPDAHAQADVETLHTRFFRIDPNTFQQGLSRIQSQIATNQTPRNSSPARASSITEVDSAAIVIQIVTQWFKSLGVDLSTPGKAIFYNDRLGALMVRATLEELDTVEKGLQMLNMSPPQVSIQVKVMEVRRDESNKLGMDLFLGTITNGAAVEHRLAKDLTVDQVRTKAPQAATLTGILTDPQFRSVIKVLEQRGGTDLLSAPSIITFSGRQAQIKVVDIKYIVTDLDITEKEAKKPSAKPGTDPAKLNPTVESQVTDDGLLIRPIAEPFELGPMVDIVPYVQADGWTIQMTVIPSLQEFIGYDDPGDFVTSVPDGKTNRVTSPTPLPKFRLRKVATSATVWDGQTLVIGAGSARHLEQKHNPDGTTTNTFVEKELFFFITPQLIDAAGNPLHSKEEQPFARKNAPPR